MSEEYSEEEENFTTPATTYVNKLPINIDVDKICDIFDELRTYTYSLGIPLLDRRGAALDLYELVASKNQQ